MDEIEYLYKRYRNQIRPFMEMLKHKRAELSDADWRDFVTHTRENIINAPDQYFSDLPNGDLLEKLVHRLFVEFFEEVG
ncbi:MAG: hypothetical protein HOP08_08410 [Cyclobacteriaceae bacterium]|nr:hypothetical protein [Cyclobacteriaceae bacterium]